MPKINLIIFKFQILLSPKIIMRKNKQNKFNPNPNQTHLKNKQIRIRIVLLKPTNL